MGVSILHRSSEKGFRQVVRNAFDRYPRDNFVARISADSEWGAAKEDNMLAKNSTDRNRFRDSENYQNLVDEVRMLADSVGIRFVPFPTDGMQNTPQDEPTRSRQVARG
jgi:hypothetical protein